MPSRFRTSFLVSSVLLAALTCGASVAGPTETATVTRDDADWTLDFDSPIAWQRVTPLGQLLISTAAGLHGVEPDTGRIAWSRNDLGRLDEERFELVPDTPFVVIASEAVPRRIVVLDAMDGRSVFDSKREGIRELLGKNVMLASGGLLIVGLPATGDDPVLALYDIATGERRWINESIFARPQKIVSKKAQKPRGKFFKMMEKVAARTGSPTEAPEAPAAAEQIAIEPIEIDSDSFLLVSDKGLFRIDAKTGKVDWKIGMFLRSTCQVFVSTIDPAFFVIGNRYTHSVNNEVQRVESVYRAYRTADGEAVWDRPVRLDGEVNRPIFHERGLVLSPLTNAKGMIKFVDYETGASLWGKKGRGIKMTGGIVDHLVMGDEILLTTGHDNAWTNKGTEYYLNILDVGAAALRFKKSHKVRGRMLATELLPNGILYVTTSEMNVLDLETGRPVHRSVVSDGSLIAAADGSTIYAFSSKDRSLYALDRADGSLRKLSTVPLKLGEGEVPFDLEIGPERITLVSSQNIAAFDRSGTLVFHAHHPAPRRSGLMRALLMANAIRAGIASAATGVYSAGFADAGMRQEPGSAGNTIAAGFAQAYGEAAVGYGSLSRQYAKAARERYKASTNASDFVFMMVRDGKRFGLARVSKQDGRIVSMIDLHRDKTPSYEVDSIANRVYYRAKPNELVGYRFDVDGTAPTASAAEPEE